MESHRLHLPNPRFALSGLLAALLAGSAPARLHGMGSEALGNEPVGAQPEWSPGVLEVANLKSRVYTRWINGNESFFFQGDERALAETLSRFAAVEAPVREVILLPGHGETRTFEGMPVSFDWELDVPSGIYLHQARSEKGTEVFYRHARLLIFVRTGGPALERVKIPAGVSVSGLDELVARYRKGLGSEDVTTRGQAAYLMGLYPAAEDSISPLVDRLRDKESYVRLCAAGALAGLGRKAAAALPQLRQRLRDAAPNETQAFQEAIQKIESSKEEPGKEERQLLEQIRRFTRSRKEKREN
jgi:hypothetical protein